MIQDRMRDSSPRLISVFATTIPYICLVAGVGAFSILYAMGRTELALKSLYLIVPLVVSAALIIARPAWFSLDSIRLVPRLSLGRRGFRYMVLTFTYLFMFSLFLRIGTSTSPLSYYIIIAAMAALIFVEILTCREENTTRKGIILVQIVLVSANLIFGQTLRLPLFFGNGDVLPHMYNINTIMETGRVTSEMLVDYQYFPLFHIFGAEANILSGMSLQTSYYLFYGLFFLVSVPLVYLLMKRITHNAHFPLVAALIYSLNREVIFSGMYMVTRVMAFILCFTILYLLLRDRNSVRWRALAIFLVAPLVVAHHTTLVHFTGILIVLAVTEAVLYRQKWNIGFNFIVFFVVAYLGYWSWAGRPFLATTLTNYAATQNVAQVPLETAPKSVLLTFSNNLDVIVIAFLALFGIISLLRARSESTSMGTVFAIFSLVALVFYSPGITSFLSKIVLASRLQLLVTPFIAFVTAGGLLLITGSSPGIMPRWSSVARGAAGIMIVFFISLSSTLFLANYIDLNLSKLLGSQNRQYFIESEISAFSFASSYGQNTLYFGDYASCAYMKNLLGLTVRENGDVLDPPSIDNGYMIFRAEELQTRGQLSFLFWGQDGSGDQPYVYLAGSTPDLQGLWELQNKIFDGSSTYIYMKRPSP